jgi:hypothetical protein
VEVTRDARPRDVAQVHPDVEAVRPHRIGHDTDRLSREVHQLVALGRAQGGHLADVTLRGDHQVPGVVRERVQQHERSGAAEEDLVTGSEVVAEDAPVVRGVGGVRRAHVLHPPGTPEAFH